MYVSMGSSIGGQKCLWKTFLSDVPFIEDFGTPVNTQPETIYDPLNDIVDVSDPPTTLPDGVELFETITTEQPVNGNQRLYDKTTIAYPFEGNEDLKFPVEAVEAEKVRFAIKFYKLWIGR